MVNFKAHFALLVTTLSAVNGFPRPALVMTSTPVTTEPTTTSGYIADSYEDLYPSRAAAKKEAESAKNIIQQFKVESEIQFRFARTTVEAYVKNPSSSAREVTFSMLLPDTAFVSNFSMTLKDENELVAKVEEKAKAREIYDAAVKQDSAAGLVHQDTRNANEIVVSVNVEGHGKARFRLTYEELLQRHLSRYQHVLHLNLDQPVEDFSVRVSINESLPIVRLRVPELKTDPNSIDSSLKDNELALVQKNVDGDPTRARILFQPDVATQKRFIESNGGDKKSLSGQLIVEYDVDRKDDESDVQLMDGYFVHFFAPDKLVTLPKHVVFVIDISGSMYGEKMKQTKDAMVTILDDLTEKDYFNIILFSSGVSHWIPESEQGNSSSLTYKGTKELRREAVRFVVGLNPNGGTNIHGSMIEALSRVTDVKVSETAIPPNTKPLIIFLTDGTPTSGVTSGPEIERLIAEANREMRVPIYGLAFGQDADYDLIKSISLTSGAFARKIFEGSDAAIQLEDFYRDLASPLLSDVKFNYVGDDFSGVTNSNDKKTFFRGNEFVVAGKLNDANSNEVVIAGEAENGKFQKTLLFCTKPLPIPINTEDISVDDSSTLRPFVSTSGCIFPPVRPEPTVARPVNFIKRLWAYLTIKNLLAEKEKVLPEKIKDKDDGDKTTMNPDFEDETTPNPDNEDETTPKPDNEDETTVSTVAEEEKKSPEEKALELALTYNFVTSLTSLVVKRPTADGSLDAEGEIKIDPLPFVSKSPARHRHSSASSHHIRLLTKSVAPATSNHISLNHRGSGGIQFAVPAIADYDDTEDEYNSGTEQPATSSPATRLFPCNITLYSQTYLRGESFSTSDDVQDLSSSSFDDKATSVQVADSCCWTLFTEKNFGGKSAIFRGGNYQSATDLGIVFREVSSLKRC